MVTWLVTNKRKVLSIERKVKVTQQMENGKNKSDVHWEFGLENSTIQTILKNRTKITSGFEQNRLRIK
jgi:CENP-B N-terminal DNA-binding domain.